MTDKGEERENQGEIGDSTDFVCEIGVSPRSSPVCEIGVSPRSSPRPDHPGRMGRAIRPDHCGGRQCHISHVRRPAAPAGEQAAITGCDTCSTTIPGGAAAVEFSSDRGGASSQGRRRRQEDRRGDEGPGHRSGDGFFAAGRGGVLSRRGLVGAVHHGDDNERPADRGPARHRRVVLPRAGHAGAFRAGRTSRGLTCWSSNT